GGLTPPRSPEILERSEKMKKVPYSGGSSPASKTLTGPAVPPALGLRAHDHRLGISSESQLKWRGPAMTKTSATFAQHPTIPVVLLSTLGIVGVIAFLSSRERPEAPASILLGVHPGRVHCLAFSPDGKMLAAGSGFPDPGGEVQLWDVSTGTP